MFKIKHGSGRLQVQAVAVPSKDGVTVTIYGGEKPHVGAVAVAVPRPSLANPEQVSSTTSVITLTGHKDDELAKPAAEKMARELEQPVVVTAGVHLNQPTAAEIETIVQYVNELVEELIARLQTKTFD